MLGLLGLGRHDIHLGPASPGTGSGFGSTIWKIRDLMLTARKLATPTACSLCTALPVPAQTWALRHQPAADVHLGRQLPPGSKSYSLKCRTWCRNSIHVCGSHLAGSHQECSSPLPSPPPSPPVPTCNKPALPCRCCLSSLFFGVCMFCF